MKRTGSIALSIIITATSSMAGFAQSDDGIHLYILKSEGNHFVPVDPSKAMMPGDKIKISFESTSESYVYVINVKPNGSRTVVFPNAQEPDNQTNSAQRYDLPRMGGFILGHQEGTELFQLLMTKERVLFLDEAVRERKGELPDPSSAAAELVSPGRSPTSRSGESAESGSRASLEQLQSIKRSLDELSLEVDTRIKNIESRLARISATVELLSRKLDELANNKPRASSKQPSRNTNKTQSQSERNKSSAPKYLDPTTGGEVIIGEKEAASVIGIPSSEIGKLSAGGAVVFEIRLKVLDSQDRVRSR